MMEPRCTPITNSTNWRASLSTGVQTRSHPSERIPQRLWKQAAALARVLPYSRVAQHVRVSPSDLKKHMATPRDSKPATSRFVEVPPPPPGPQRRRSWRWSLNVPMVRVCA